MIKGRGRGDAARSVMSRLVRGPSEADKYARYRDDYEAFFYDELGVSLLTDSQRGILKVVRDNERTVVTSATGTGKTFLLGGLAVLLFVCWDRSGVYVSAAPPEPNLRNLAWGEIMRFVSQNPAMFSGMVIKDLIISKSEYVAAAKHSTREGRSRIQGLTIPSQGREDKMEASFSGKHNEDSVAHLHDEGDGIPDPCYRGADGCLSGSGNQKQVIFLNPKVRDGEPWRMIETGIARHVVLSAFDHPNVQTGKMIIPGAVTREKTLERINLWTSPLNPYEEPDEFCFVVPDFLIGQTCADPRGGVFDPLPAGYRRIDDLQFYTKVLGTYPPVSSGALVNLVKLSEAVMRWKMYRKVHGIDAPADIAPAMTFDVADNPTLDRAVTMFKYGDYVDLPVRLLGTDAHDYAGKAADLYHARKVSICYVDSTGLGTTVPHIMIRNHNCPVVIGVRFSKGAPWSDLGTFGTMRDYCIYMMARWINSSSTAMIPDDERLIAALKIVEGKTTDKFRVTDKRAMRKSLGFSPDEMDALSLYFAPKTFFSGGI